MCIKRLAARQQVEKLCRTIWPGDAGYEHARADLHDAERHAVIVTPLLWRAHATSGSL